MRATSGGYPRSRVGPLDVRSTPVTGPRRVVLSVLLSTTLGFAATGCADDEPRTVPPASDPLASLVSKEDLGTLSTSVTFLLQRCGDIDSPAAAARALTEAASGVGLEPGDQRWGSAARSLVTGVSSVSPGEACRPELSGWLDAGLAPDTIPVPAPEPTIVPLAEYVTELASDDSPPSAPEDFARLETGQSLAEVRAILGSEGVLEEESTVGAHHNQLVRWPAQGEGFATVRVQFRDGRLLAATTSGDR